MRFFLDMAINPLLLTGLLGGLLAGLACGVMGPYVVTRRIVFLAGAIAHTVVGGIGAALFLRYHYDLPWLNPMVGAVTAALLSALLIGLIQNRLQERLDTLIGAMWATGMAVGILLVKYTPGYQTELLSYLFGNLALVGTADVYLLVALNVVILATVSLYHKRFEAVSLDEEYAGVQGVNVLAMNLLLLALVSLAVVAMIRVVGLILVIALLSLPAATAGLLTRRLGPMIAMSTMLCLVLVTIPRIAVYGTRIAPESAIVLAAAAVYLAVLALTLARRCQARSHRSADR